MPRQVSMGSSDALASLRQQLAEHLSRRREVFVGAWATSLRLLLKLPKASGWPDPATQAFSYKELSRLLQGFINALSTNDFSALSVQAAANHHEPFEQSASIARLIAKLRTLGDLLRRSVMADPALDTLPTLYLLDRILGKIHAEALLVCTDKRRQGFERIAQHSQELKETLQAILDSSPVGILVTDREGYITYFNREQERVSGVSRERALGKKIYEEYARRTDQEVRAAFQKAIEQGLTTSFVRRAYPSRRGQQYLDLHLGPIRDPDGKTIGTVHICRDVTDYTHLEEQLVLRNRELAAKVNELEEAYTYIGKVNRQFASLIDVNSTLGSKLSLDKVLDFIVRSAAMLTRARLVTLRRLDGRQLNMASQFGFSTQEAANYRSADVDKSAIGRVIRENRQILIADLSREVGFQWPELLSKFSLKSLVSVPLHSRGRTIGVLSIHLSELRQFSNLELNFLVALANQAALAIDLERTLRAVRPLREQKLHNPAPAVTLRPG